MFGRFLILFQIMLFGGFQVWAGNEGGPPGKLPKRVLMLYAERNELPAIRAIDSGVREALDARGGVEIFSEYLDFSRFPAEQHGEALTDWLRTRYQGVKMDLLIPAGYEALQFTLSCRDAVFPGVPVTYCGVARHQLPGVALPSDFTGALLYYDFGRTIDLALKLQPDLKEVVCVIGSSDFDRRTGEDALTALAAHPGLAVRNMSATPYDEMMEQVRHLPSTSMVLHTSMLRDAAGRSRGSTPVAGELGAASSVPVYGVAAHQLQKGLIGGAMMDFAAHGKDIGALAVARLDGGGRVPPQATSSPWMVNWEALKKWRIPEKRIPKEAIVRFKKPSMWGDYPLTIVGILAVTVMQSTLIAALILNRSTRLRAQREVAEGNERMNLAARAANLGMWAWDVAGDDAWMTEQARAMFGIKQDVRIDYAALLDRVHPEDRADRERAIRDALGSHGEYEMDYRIISPGRDVRWVSARGRCVASPNGRGQKLLGVSMDVTARKELEMESAQQRQDLEHLSRLALMGEMAASLAHELNQPLTAIVTNARAAQRFIARGEVDPHELEETLADIVVDGRRAGEVIRGIKSMVRKVDIDRHVIDANQLIENVVRLVRGDALAHGCHISTEEDASPALLMGDAIQLQQVLLNLVINAFDAMRHPPCNPCRVDISARRTGDGEIEISVRDFGPGLSPEVATKIFDRFFSTKTEGMGMGLSIARSIVEVHGGILGVGHPEGGGARFWFTVPAYVENNEEVAV